MPGRAKTILILGSGLFLLAVSPVSAAIRYAAPTGTGADPCARPAKPCSVYVAADENAPGTSIAAGDIVELAPGTYYARKGAEIPDIKTVANLPPGVTVRGQAGKARPLFILRSSEAGSAFYVPAGSEVADVEIRNQSGRDSAISLSGGTMTRVIARSKNSGPESTCGFLSGTIRSSACLNSGGGSAIGANVADKGTYAGVIRNSTLISTGPGSVGMSFVLHAFKRGMTAKIDAVGVLVRGEEKDVSATGLALNRGRGATVDIDLRASNYATVETETSNGGTATITAPGTNGNSRALPLLAADNLHQLPGSPTIDAGAVDGASGAVDVDGQPWTLSGLPDVGADELAPADPQVNPVPNAVLGKHPRERTWLRRTEITFGSSELGSRFECRLDRTPFRTCSSPYGKKVSLGGHRFQVRAIDPEGRVDRTPAVVAWSVLPLRSFVD